MRQELNNGLAKQTVEASNPSVSGVILHGDWKFLSLSHARDRTKKTSFDQLLLQP